jgi:hypothetical protein
MVDAPPRVPAPGDVVEAGNLAARLRRRGVRHKRLDDLGAYTSRECSASSRSSRRRSAAVNARLSACSPAPPTHRDHVEFQLRPRCLVRERWRSTERAPAVRPRKSPDIPVTPLKRQTRSPSLHVTDRAMRVPDRRECIGRAHPSIGFYPMLGRLIQCRLDRQCGRAQQVFTMHRPDELQADRHEEAG